MSVRDKNAIQEMRYAFVNGGVWIDEFAARFDRIDAVARAATASVSMIIYYTLRKTANINACSCALATRAQSHYTLHNVHT